ncbi:MAG: DUF1080 domain-containing protein [Acidobacteriota bacterium]|nr:DUF1080 domain-containing protein [Acidobacteriota bacterium]
MKPLYLSILFVSAVLLTSGFQGRAGNGLYGRWDLTMSASGQTYPSWIEVADGSSPAVRIVSRTGSVHPGSDVKLEGTKLSFAEAEGRTKWDLALEGDKLAGTQHRGDLDVQVTGVHAPLLDRKAPAKWSAPEALFNGKNLDGWTPDNPAKNHWKVIDGALVNEAPGANIRTDREFTDFKLHIEYNCPQNGNSGVYLRGRYETQVEYEPAGTDDRQHSMGSIYGFLAPSADVSPRPGQWESYDIALVGRTVTVVRDGVKTIDAQQIPGITGGALNSNEGDPGPIYIQGDHTGGMKYRNITISVPVS